MKKIICLCLCLAGLLCGCGRGEEETARALQQQYSQLQQVTAQAEIVCHMDGASRSFTVSCVWEPEGATTTVTAPEEIAGLRATVTGEELLLRYEGAALAAGVPTVLSPAAAVPWLLRSVSRGYLLDCGAETLDGMACLRAAFDNTAPDGGKILCTVWFTRDTGVPCYAEFSEDGAVVLTIRMLSFDMT